MLLSIFDTFAGGSACALGVPGACDTVYYPNYYLQIVTVFSIGLIAIILGLIIIKRAHEKSKTLLFIGIIWAVAFSGYLLYANFTSETELERTQERAKICAETEHVYGIIACEY